ncbi:MAG: septal ring lytic transglycosylase RlpA family protein [Deltaproteobacteria bacterium]|nr:septal ring lytic transglycosylase RlpA family protein [Deltaproteobacteria bacterium]
MRQRYQFSPLIAAVILSTLLIPGCATRRISPPPAYIISRPAAKRIPARARIPATQKPYRVGGRTYYPIPSAYGFTQTGIASWYGRKFHGRKTSNGETYNMYAATAAHKTLPMNTHVLVENLTNGKRTIVRINDRGPFVRTRIIDMTYSGAAKLGMLRNGTARVRLTALGEAVRTSRGGRRSERFLPYQNFSRGDFFVQVGAFSRKANADRLKESLLSQGYKTISRFYRTDTGSFYRVQVRAGKSLQAAHRMETRLSPRFPGAFVIAK